MMDMPLAVMAGDGRTRTPTEQDLLRDHLEAWVARLNSIRTDRAFSLRRWSAELEGLCYRCGARVVMDTERRRLVVEYARPGDVWEVTRGSS